MGVVFRMHSLYSRVLSVIRVRDNESQQNNYYDLISSAWRCKCKGHYQISVHKLTFAIVKESRYKYEHIQVCNSVVVVL